VLVIWPNRRQTACPMPRTSCHIALLHRQQLHCMQVLVLGVVLGVVERLRAPRVVVSLLGRPSRGHSGQGQGPGAARSVPTILPHLRVRVLDRRLQWEHPPLWV